jgi:bifunctional UDP-N-acetylglucosamine pyrophosphorylase/glucosamine-1-phosphate N-acetyltransferase
MTQSSKSAAIIMAAGKGTRMKDPSKAKVMYELLGHPMLHYVLQLTEELGFDRVVVVVGYQKDVVLDYVKKAHPATDCVVQEQQLGTGHAVMQAEQALLDFDGYVIVLSGDVPLLTTDSVQALTEHHIATGAKATILTADVADPTGYGRIIRGITGDVARIVEHRDANDEELSVHEINSGIYVFEKACLFEALKHIRADNVQHEYYLTDVFQYFNTRQWKVAGLRIQHIDEIQGINTFAQLEEARNAMGARAQ